jgi:outer membrane receptor protein involved in Fe transport
VVNTAGQRGGLSSLFVRGGESNYNKVIVDGVTINEPGGTFDFGTLPLTEANRMEFLRGTQSTLYGSDAMTSVVQVWTRAGSTRVPELRFGADGGNFSTANGYASLAGARGRFDYNVFGDQFNTNGSGINNAIPTRFKARTLALRSTTRFLCALHMRHSNSHTGVPGEWSFNGYDPLVNENGMMNRCRPIPASGRSSTASGQRGTHGGRAFGLAAPLYRLRLSLPLHDLNLNGDPARVSPLYGQFDFPIARIRSHQSRGISNTRAITPSEPGPTPLWISHRKRKWRRGDLDFPPSHGQRLNQDAYLQQQLTWGRLSAVAGGRFVHSSVFGNTGVPRVALTLLARRGGEIFFCNAAAFFLRHRIQGAPPGRDVRRTALFYSQSRSQAGAGPRLRSGHSAGFLPWKICLNATYFNNLFHDQINYETVNPTTFVGEYFNVNEAFAQGAEVELQAKLRRGCC